MIRGTTCERERERQRERVEDSVDCWTVYMARYFEDIELHKDTNAAKYRMKKDGRKHTLIILEAGLEDIGMYHCWTNGGHTKGELEVEGTNH